jgi:DNA-directed RNA polymerase specialized sigma24 family protein
MDKQLQEAVFNEVMNRYGRFIYMLIKEKFEGEDIKDMYQEFSIFLFQQIGKYYSESANLFDTKAWIRTVTNNFCISELRRRNGKKKLKFITEEKTEVIRKNAAIFLAHLAKDEELNKAVRANHGFDVLMSLKGVFSASN